MYGSQWVGTDGGTGDLELAAWHTLRFGETTQVTVKLDPAGTISGTVTDDATGAPVSEVCVTVTPAEPWYVNPYQPHCTSSEGKYTLSGLGPYAWRVQFPDASNRYAWEWSGDKSDRFAAQPVQVQPGGTTTADAQLSPPGKVTGRITGMTLPPQYVTIYSINALTDDWAGRAGTVTSDGQYTLPGLNTQSILIDFADTNQGLQRHPTSVAVTAGQTTNVDLQVN
ncbi:carboxypeptidase-like regulatory domain-containing protein [Lentzea sp.]|uniref:carboxypeptidase-like regulatory domain-containing protein n=1 Tax=Lentzea sp. TaxID=56099 RepID=UPI002BFBBA15|nr:carboxypeptidase-like regulatory domain-containing protein [Lentzea sp.]HUQ55888.1 carboxypeptidase-like regulatory domain-containing protein [Lentzea sp.]